MKTIGIFVIALLIAMVSVTSGASVDLVHKDTTTWNETDSAGLLDYTMPCAGEVMNYTFTIVEPSNMLANTPYSLVFYSRAETGTWNPDTVWNNQDTSLIDSGTTDGSGNLALSGTFDFGSGGQGLEYIHDGKDYDGSVKGAKVWLVPSTDYDEAQTKITNWNPTHFLFETELIQCMNIQEVVVTVNCPQSLEVSPLTYDYGTIYPDACSGTNPSGQITLSNTGCPNLLISTITTGIFENIDYAESGQPWTDANSFSVTVNSHESKGIDTKICIPSDETPDIYTGTVTYEYIEAI